MNTNTDSKSMFYDQMVKALEELCERIESMRRSSMKPEAECPKQQDAGNSSVNLDQVLIVLQDRIHALEKRVREVDSILRRVNQLDNPPLTLSQTPTPADIESEMAKAFMEWAKEPHMATKFRFDAFKAGVLFGLSKPFQNQTL